MRFIQLKKTGGAPEQWETRTTRWGATERRTPFCYLNN